MTHLLIVVVLLLLTGCTNLRQCAMYAKDSPEHTACINKAYMDAAGASTMPPVLGLILKH